jgi:hypothetical protein
MRYMLLIYGDENAYANVSEADQEAQMGKWFAYTEEMRNAGVSQAGDALQSTSTATTVRDNNGEALVTDGPFAETKELIAGYWIINVKSKAEAIEWAKKIPFKQLPNSGREPEVELRQFFELEDFPNAPPEVVEQEKNFGRK